MPLINLLRKRAIRTVPPQRRRLDLGPRSALGCLYIVGDIHGRYDALLRAEDKVRADIRRHETPGMMVLLGDYVDRGPDSRKVISHLLHNEEGLTRLMLCGNHDDMFLQAIEGRIDPSAWLSFGGRETLFSYGIDAHEVAMRGGRQALARAMAETVPLPHVQFLRHLPSLARSDDFVFVHAGVRPGMKLDRQNDDDLLWIREPFLSVGPRLPVTVVHGHTITPEPVFVEGRIGIDTGAYQTGILSILKIDANRLSLL